MAPEQAQGLETLDARADVFALAAIAYECAAGRVPFEGTNGPSILLAIMTKEPEPPSLKGKNAAIPPPPTLDPVMEEALAKNPNIRTKTVGALADAVGHAYGLRGDHAQWATTPQSELGRLCAEARPALMAPPRPVVPMGAEADPFAQPAVAQSSAVPPVRMTGSAVDGAFAAMHESEFAPVGVPSGRAPWVIPVVVGLAALVVGGGLALVFVLAR
jgi:serine/threonine-protein kinase